MRERESGGEGGSTPRSNAMGLRTRKKLSCESVPVISRLNYIKKGQKVKELVVFSKAKKTS